MIEFLGVIGFCLSMYLFITKRNFNCLFFILIRILSSLLLLISILKNFNIGVFMYLWCLITIDVEYIFYNYIFKK